MSDEDEVERMLSAGVRRMWTPLAVGGPEQVYHVWASVIFDATDWDYAAEEPPNE